MLTHEEILGRLRQIRDSQSAVVGHVVMAAHTLTDNLIFELAALASKPEPLEAPVLAERAAWIMPEHIKAVKVAEHNTAVALIFRGTWARWLPVTVTITERKP